VLPPAAVVTFLGSRYWTFRHRRRAGLGRETVTFIAANLAGILIQQAPGCPPGM